LTASALARPHAGASVTALGFCMAVFAWGSYFYGNGFYLVALAERHGWPTGVISSAITTGFFACTPSSIAVGWVFDLHGRGRGALAVVAYGALAMSAGIALLGRIDSLWQLYAVYALMGSAYPALAAPAISAILTQRVRRGYGLALSLALTGASVGGAVAAPGLVWASARLGFEGATTALAVLILAVLVPFAIVVLWPRPAPAPADARAALEAGDAARRARSPALGEVLRSATFTRIALAGLLSLIAQVGFLAHQLAALEPALGRGMAALAISATAISSVLGRFLTGALATRVRLDRLAAIAYVVQALGIGLVAIAQSPVALLVGCVVAGFFVGAVVMLPPMLCRACFDEHYYGRVYGMVAVGVYFGGGLGPSLAGLVRDASGSYFPALLALAVISLAAAAVVRGVVTGKFADRIPVR
jgi:MFS family permease